MNFYDHLPQCESIKAFEDYLNLNTRQVSFNPETGEVVPLTGEAEVIAQFRGDNKAAHAKMFTLLPKYISESLYIVGDLNYRINFLYRVIIAAIVLSILSNALYIYLILSAVPPS